MSAADYEPYPDGPTMTPEEEAAYEAYCRAFDCPLCGETEVVEAFEGGPSMLGYGDDPGTYDLACGHRVTFSPLDGKPWVREIPAAAK